MLRELYGERHSRVIKAATVVVHHLLRLNRRQEAYDLVMHSLVKASSNDPSIQLLRNLEGHLLSETIRKGFRQPPKRGKHKAKKKRR